jgi:hypothetical protein
MEANKRLNEQVHAHMVRAHQMRVEAALSISQSKMRLFG